MTGRGPNETAPESHGPRPAGEDAWWRGVSAYEWLVLAIASAGWIFDSYEAQIFNITRSEMLADLLGAGASGGAAGRWGDIFLGIFLVGGTCGGLLFGWLSDRWGRKPTMIATILMYSVFSCLTGFATNLTEVGVLRFLVAMGVAGEWAVAASLVSETFPKHARAHAGAIFHAMSFLGVWAAALAGIAVGPNWRYAYFIGLLPALLVLWLRAKVREPDRWRQAREAAVSSEVAQLGSFRELLLDPRWNRRALLGMALAAVGLGTFWAVTVAGQDLAMQMLVRTGQENAAAKAKFAYGIVEATGSGLGLVAFGPCCVRFGRRGAFVLFQIIALMIVPIVCYLPQSYAQLLILLPAYGFFTGGMHSGFAVYFPELFPTRLRSTGTAFCFHGGRMVAASVLVFSGWLKSLPGIDLRLAVTMLSWIFVLGIVIVLFLPETKDRPLIE